MHYQNPYLPHAQRTAAAQSPARRAPQVALDHEGLPVGTAAQVMTWVDDDPQRALQFLSKEQAEPRPRVSLVANLKAVLKRNDIEPPALEQKAEPLAIEPSGLDEFHPDTAENIDPLALVRERLSTE